MKKKLKQDIDAALSKALAAPEKRRPSPQLDNILNEYAPDVSEAVPQPNTVPTSGTVPEKTTVPNEPVELYRSGTVLTDTPVPPPSTVPISGIVPEQYTAFPNGIFDKVMPTLKPNEQVVLARLYRLSRGFHSETCRIGYGRLAKLCNISRSTAQIATERLLAFGYIEVVGIEQGGQNKQDRGTTYKMNLPAATIPRRNTVPAKHTVPGIGTVPTVGSNKESFKKEIDKRESAPPNFQNCPDCHGTGFNYVDELDRGKGVEKCSHAKLKT